MYIDNRHKKLVLYIFAQFIGALLGAFVSWGLLGTIDPPYSSGWESIAAPKFMLN